MYKLISCIFLLFHVMIIYAQSSVEIIKKEVVKEGNESLMIIQLDRDGNKNNFESIGANYDYVFRDGRTGSMSMFISGISEGPDKNNRYLMSYVEINRKTKEKSPTHFCTINAKFGKYILNLARTSMNNNGKAAFLIYPLSSSTGVLQNIRNPRLEDRVTANNVENTTSGNVRSNRTKDNMNNAAAKTNKNNSITGYSHYVFSDGSRFEGHYVKGVIDGTGIYYWSNTHYYVGHWSNGKRHGYGIEFFDNGTYRLYYYENEKVVNRSISQSKTLNTNTGVYTGEMSNGRACGKGTFRWKNGTRFDGTWTADGKSRYGVLYNGQTSNPNTVGQWTNEKLNGYACVLSSNGKMQVGFWENGNYKYKTVFR